MMRTTEGAHRPARAKARAGTGDGGRKEIRRRSPSLQGHLSERHACSESYHLPIESELC